MTISETLVYARIRKRTA